MKVQLGGFIFVSLILGLFFLARNRKAHTSKALWIAVVWLAIGSSRNLSEWLHFAPPDSSDRYLEGNPLDRAFLSGLLVLGAIALLSRQRRVAAVLRMNWPIVLYFAYCGVSVLWSDYPDVSSKRWIRSLGDIVMVLLVLTDPDWLAALKRFFSRVGFVLMPVSMLFILYIPSLGRTYSRGGSPAWTGVCTDKNALGMICLVFGLASTWHLLQWYQAGRANGKKGPLIAHAIMTLLAAWLLVKSNSATALACWILAASIMALTSLSRMARRPGFIHLLVGGALLVVVSAMFLNTGSGLVHTLGRDNTFTGRTAIWTAAIPLVPNPIVGAGYESFWLGPRLQDVARAISQTLNQAHNGYIEIFLNLGVMGLILLGVVFVTGYRRIVAAVRRQEEASGLRLAYFVTAALYNVSEAGFKMMHPIWVALLLAVIVLPKQMRTSNLRGNVGPNRAARPEWPIRQELIYPGARTQITGLP